MYLLKLVIPFRILTRKAAFVLGYKEKWSEHVCNPNVNVYDLLRMRSPTRVTFTCSTTKKSMVKHCNCLQLYYCSIQQRKQESNKPAHSQLPKRAACYQPSRKQRRMGN